MKKLFLCAAVAVFAFANVNAQTFGAKAGVDLASNKVEFEGVSVTASETGFYVGVFAQIEISEEFAFQPEVMYVSIKDGGEIHIPLMANYSVSEEFSILAGPALGILTDTADGFSSFNYGIEAGAAYDITEEFLIEARYSLGLAELIEDAPDGFSSKLSGFYIGVGYKF
ncbi:porin family protein [uncultured Winogradskyella sp.]|uniref:porin family protein n=1 Tax=uncultured Winogradskyella sp. TaxID=395353 RepID=UPI0030DCDDDC|tara:strand:- start:86 stop:592 length:507 start_codon:yes stop_codon:yes gene_type:complete